MREQYQLTIIFVTHDIEEAVLLGDRVAVMGGRPPGIRDIIDVPLARPRHAMRRPTRRSFSRSSGRSERRSPARGCDQPKPRALPARGIRPVSKELPDVEHGRACPRPGASLLTEDPRPRSLDRLYADGISELDDLADYRRSRHRARTRRLATGASGLLALAIIWQVAAMLANSVFLPSVTQTIQTLRSLHRPPLPQPGLTALARRRRQPPPHPDRLRDRAPPPASSWARACRFAGRSGISSTRSSRCSARCRRSRSSRCSSSGSASASYPRKY